MNTDVAGRVRNVQLPASKPLLPLFEAIMNSVHAIEDAKESDGKIEIEVLRSGQNLFGESERSLDEIVGFVVRDNGIGFDEQNFQAFVTSDTTYKANRGGKGIGRFMWLAAFDRAEVESVFGTNGTTKRRRFDFCTSGTGIEKDVCTDVVNQKRVTTVRLIGFKEKYRQQAPKKLETIAAFIVEEFLEYFIGTNPPVMTLREVATGEAISLAEFFEEELASQIKRDRVEVKGGLFEVLHVRLYSTHINEHRQYFCAHGRVVLPEKLIGRIPNLVRHLSDDSGKDFVYAAYVNSSILDEAINSDRTTFNLSDDGQDRLFGTTLDAVRSKVLEACNLFLAPYTAPVASWAAEALACL